MNEEWWVAWFGNGDACPVWNRGIANAFADVKEVVGPFKDEKIAQLIANLMKTFGRVALKPIFNVFPDVYSPWESYIKYRRPGA